MNRFVVGLSLGLLIVAASRLGAADKGKRGPEVAKGDAQEAKQLVALGAVSGKIVDVGGGNLTLRVFYPTQTDKKGVAASQQLLFSLQQMARQNRSQAQKSRIFQELALAEEEVQKPRFANQHRDFQVNLADDAKVRLGQLTTRYDDKGRLIEYTAQELKDLKGSDAKIPGYSSSVGNIKTGQTVLVYLANKKTKDEPDVAKPAVTMLVVLKEADPPPPAKEKKKKK